MRTFCKKLAHSLLAWVHSSPSINHTTAYPSRSAMRLRKRSNHRVSRSNFRLGFLKIHGVAHITINHVPHHQNQDEAPQSHAINQIHQINTVIEPDLPDKVIITSMRNTKLDLRDKRLYTRLFSNLIFGFGLTAL